MDEPDNPYLDHYLAMREHQLTHGRGVLLDDRPMPWCIECLLTRPDEHRDDARWEVKRRFAWAIPDRPALRMIARYAGPDGLVELGAGSGYWAWMLDRCGVKVHAYDPAPPSSTPDGTDWHNGQAWFPVRRGDHTVIGEYPPEWALLLVWPSYEDPWAARAVEAFRGDTICYVGEGPGGCTGDDRLHALLGETPFTEVDSAAIPRWAGLHDWLSIHQRKAKACPR